MGPIAYFPLWDSGSVTQDVSGYARHGTHLNVTPLQLGIGDGYPSVLYVPDNDSYTNILTPELSGAFSGVAGAVAGWSRASQEGVWTDGVLRTLMYLRVNGSNNVWVYTPTGDNALRLTFEANDVVKQAQTSISTTGWFHWVLTWDANAGATGEARAYIDSVQIGSVMENLGVWAGVINRALIGSFNLTPTNVWDGYTQHVSIFDRALTPGEVRNMYFTPTAILLNAFGAGFDGGFG